MTTPLELSLGMNAAEFARQRLDFEPDPHQTRVLMSTANRAILNCTRQWGKSTVCAIKALHRALYTPGKDVVIACPSQRQSAEFLNKVSAFLQILDIPRKGDGRNRHSLKLPNESRIIALPGQLQQTVRGFSALSLLIIDEAAQVTDTLYLALRPMLAVGRGDLWLLSTPYGKRGFFYRAWTEAGHRWERFTVPATECPRISPEFLQEEREAGGARYFGQEYLCEFHSTHDALFDETLIRLMLCDQVDPLVFDTVTLEDIAA
jgi:hypothetical protein